MNAAAFCMVLNEMLALDPYAVRQLVERRVVCSAALATHPNLRVQAIAGQDFVGMLGVLNGILDRFGKAGGLVAVYEGGELVRFAVEREDA